MMLRTRFLWIIFGLLCWLATPCVAWDDVKQIPLSTLDLSHMSQGWGRPVPKGNVVKQALRIAGKDYQEGVGTHAVSVLHLALDGQVLRFTAEVGIDESAGRRGSVRFQIYADRRLVFDSDVMHGSDPAKPVDVNLEGVKELLLFVDGTEDGIDFDHADWANAVFYYRGQPPHTVAAPEEPREILTPKPGPAPQLNHAGRYGCRPGRPFIYRIPCTGERPIKFSAMNLPSTLHLDPATGIITGHAPRQRGEYEVQLIAENQHGKDVGKWTIVVGDTLALTPPMGWNSWYIHYHRVSDADMRAAADAMIDSGMADFGYCYVNIDDCWMVKPGSDDPKLGGPPRDEAGAVRPNGKFPNMKALTDYIHSKGLKAGIYISPGPLTCAGYVGSYQHEEIDAKKFAEWGFDFLKYDWCSYGRVVQAKTREDFMKPYRLMGDILKRLDRDIVYNLCQYGMDSVWEWGAEVGGNCWRTTGDLGLAGGSLNRGIYQVGLKIAKLWEYARPGHWNDPDYLLIGWVGDARVTGEGRPTPLTPNEQYSHMSMWCLMAAPLIFSGDMTRLDDFTLNILCNREVIAVDQDILGQQARIVRQTATELVLAKPLVDGSVAVGLFNLGEFPQKMTITWQELNRQGPQRVRDLWRQKDLGISQDGYTSTVGRHGVTLIRVTTAKESQN
ncbi:MAG TPA: NPCBM/NEW2 domain-containing protein [Thermogutta sp.]|nr:NPCBM/NEW2 domain-containing protein [Thermogutta sp.]